MYEAAAGSRIPKNFMAAAMRHHQPRTDALKYLSDVWGIRIATSVRDPDTLAETGRDSCLQEDASSQIRP
jgi:hypothetical protein